MTVSKVTQMNLYAGNAQSVGQTSKNSQSDEFSQIFASQSSDAESKFSTVRDTSGKENERMEVQEEDAVKDTKETISPDEKKDVSEVTDTENVAEMEEEPDAEAIKEAIEEIMATIQQVLGVTQEELQGAMQELGIFAEDLLNTEMISKLAVALTEGADELSIMTNEDLFANVQEITAKVESVLQELAQEMNLTLEELKQMIQDMKGTEVLPEVEVLPEEEVVKPFVADNKPDVPVMEEIRVQTSVEKADGTQNTDDGRAGADAGANQQMSYAQVVAERIEQAVVKAEATYSSATSTENIMNQIRDVIRIIQTQDTTEMELQLHPASLGHVRVQMAMKDGVLTATFTTENEAVRAALESQMLTLKQNFEEQGIKVEAVEVTVASHAFEHNLNGDGNGANEETAPEKKKTGRRITLSELTNEIEEEEMSDEDRIVAEMMRQNGNTVDYTV